MGDFKDVPVSGGLKAVEEKFGAKWRKRIRGGAKQMSRIKALMKAIDEMAAGSSLEEAIDKLELVFQAKDGGKKRLSNLVDILKQQGIVASRLPRGPSGRGVGSG